MDNNEFTIAGFSGFTIRLEHRKQGGQHAGMPPVRIRIKNRALGINVVVEKRSQMEARDLAIIAVASILEHERLFSRADVHQEALRLTDEEYEMETQANNQSNNQSEDYYEF